MNRSKTPPIDFRKELPPPKERPLSAPNVNAKNPWLHDLLRRRKPKGFVGE